MSARQMELDRERVKATVALGLDISIWERGPRRYRCGTGYELVDKRKLVLVWLRDNTDLSYKEIGAACGMSHSNAVQAVNRARKVIPDTTGAEWGPGNPNDRAHLPTGGVRGENP